MPFCILVQNHQLLPIMDLQELKNHYATLSTIELLELSKSWKDLREDAIPYLLDELEKRGEKVEFKTEVEENVTDIEDHKALQEELNERLANDESVDSIRENFVSRGINFMEVLAHNEEMAEQERLYNLTTEKKLTNISETDIQNHLVENEGLNEYDAYLQIENLKKRGKRNQLFGLLWLFGAITITLFSYESRKITGSYIIYFGAMIYGIIRFFVGLKQANSN
jgi:hypothetical protein